jgi:hypothetical protein
LKEIQNGTGVVTRKDEMTFQLVDDAAQLEFFYFEKIGNVCNKPLNKLKNLDIAYLQITSLDWSPVYRKWVFARTNIPVKSVSESKPLLLQHHQFMEHQAIVNENILAKEIRKIYCGNLQVRKFTTMLLAESNGLIAARANNLPQCQRLKVLGEYFIIQKCTSKNITVGMKMTRCGHEPFYNNFTIGKDGFSLHPFQNCFWKDDTISLNGKAYRWMGEKWTEIFPTVHLATLHLARKFSELEDNEARYAIPISNPFERAEYEQANSVNEIIHAIHESNSHSLSAILVNEHEESRWWSLHAWSAKLQTALITVCAAVSGLAIILLLLWKYKSQLRGVQAILEHFAVDLQNNRRNRTPALTDQQ